MILGQIMNELPLIECLKKPWDCFGSNSLCPVFDTEDLTNPSTTIVLKVAQKIAHFSKVNLYCYMHKESGMLSSDLKSIFIWFCFTVSLSKKQFILEKSPSLRVTASLQVVYGTVWRSIVKCQST